MPLRSFKSDSSLTLLGKVVKALRAEAGLTQEELAARAGTYISRIEGGGANLTWTALGMIYQGLGVPRSVLVNRVEDLEGRQ